MTPPAALLLDRDGTLVHDVPYNADPARVRPVDGVRDAIDAARSAGVKVAMVTNQSGVARGRLELADVDLVNRRIEELLGPFDVIVVCPHGPDDGCDCRKPAPGLLLRAADSLGVPIGDCVMIGDRAADMDAARAAGARGVLIDNGDGERALPTTAEAVRALVAPGAVPLLR